MTKAFMYIFGALATFATGAAITGAHHQFIMAGMMWLMTLVLGAEVRRKKR